MARSAKTPVWEARGADQREAVRDMFAEIAPTYDLANSIMSARGHYRWRAEAIALLNLKAGDAVLDLCCGTGDFLIATRPKIGNNAPLVGLDYCGPMLQIAAQKVDPATKLILGDATDIPFQDGAFDAITVGWGLRNVPDLETTLSEVLRVLKPGGRFVSVDMSTPEGPIGPISRWAYRISVPLLGRILRHPEAYAYLPKSTERFLSRRELAQKFTEAGLEGVRHHARFFGNIAIHIGTKPGGTQ